jgi:hypothetical protein
MIFTSKYAILVYINLPLIAFGIVGAITNYKTSRISKGKCVFRVVFWLTIGLLLAFFAPAYDFLVRYRLTSSPSMSIFDIFLLTLVLFCFMLIKRANEKSMYLNRRITRLHENLVLSEARLRQRDRP